MYLDRKRLIAFGCFALTACGGGGGGADGETDGSGGDESSMDETGFPCDQGEVGCECLPDNGCDPGLACEEGVCVPEAVEGYCGDGNLDPGEECDLHEMHNADDGVCTTACTLARCGDGLVATWESCDDGNASDSDACTSECKPASCGDGFVQDPEGCDDGNADETDGCLSTCVEASCGDGFVQAGVEDCDPAIPEQANYCTSTCTSIIATCGNGQADPGEFCYEEADVLLTVLDPLDVFLVDVNGDNHLDLNITSDNGTIQLFLGDGQGGLAPEALIPANGNTGAPAFRAVMRTDANGGRNVAVIGPATIISYEALDTSPYWQGTGTTTVDSLLGTVSDATLIDHDGDGSDSLLVSGLGSTELLAVGFDPQSIEQWDVGPLLATNDTSSGVAFVNSVQFDASGAEELALSDSLGVGFTIASGEDAAAGSGAPLWEAALPNQLPSGKTEAADLSGDGSVDLLVPRSTCDVNSPPASCAAGHVFIFPRDASGEAEATTQYEVGKHPYLVRAADLTSDGHPEIIAANAVSGDVIVRLSSEAGTYDDVVVIPTPATRTRIGFDLGDLNEDGQPDFFVALNTLNLGYLYLSNP